MLKGLEFSLYKLWIYIMCRRILQCSSSCSHILASRKYGNTSNIQNSISSSLHSLPNSAKRFEYRCCTVIQSSGKVKGYLQFPSTKQKESHLKPISQTCKCMHTTHTTPTPKTHTQHELFEHVSEHLASAITDPNTNISQRKKNSKW